MIFRVPPTPPPGEGDQECTQADLAGNDDFQPPPNSDWKSCGPSDLYMAPVSFTIISAQ